MSSQNTQCAASEVTVDLCIEECAHLFTDVPEKEMENWCNELKIEFSAEIAAGPEAFESTPVSDNTAVPDNTAPVPDNTAPVFSVRFTNLLSTARSWLLRSSLWTTLKKRSVWPCEARRIVTPQTDRIELIHNHNTFIYIYRKDQPTGGAVLRRPASARPQPSWPQHQPTGGGDWPHRSGVRIYVENTEVRTMEEVDEAIISILVRVKRPMVPQLSFDDYATVPSVKYMSHAVAVSGEALTDDLHAPAGKRYAVAVYGDSGAGKTVYSCFTLPERLKLDYKKGDIVLHISKIIQEKKENQDSEKELKDTVDELFERVKKAKVAPDRKAEFRLLVAQEVLKHRHLAKDYEKTCDTIFAARQVETESRDVPATDLVIAILKREFGSNKWTRDNQKNLEKFRTVLLVLDEIGKCIPFARAVAASLDKICTSDWVTRRMEKLIIVFCGTGSESLWSQSRTQVATDPRTIRAVHIKQTTAEYTDALHRYILDVQTNLPTLKKAVSSDKVVAIIESNARMGALFARILRTHLCNFQINNSATHRLIQQFDRAMANSIRSLFVPATFLAYCNSNGLATLSSPPEMRVMDVALVYIQHKYAATQYPPIKGKYTEVTLVPLPKPQGYDDLLNDAARYGLLVRESAEMSPAAGLLVMGAFGTPCDFVDGEELELFTHGWLQRLLEAQSGLPVQSVKFGTRQLPKRDTPLDTVTLREVLDALEESGSVVILNGEKAPGADVMSVQIRPLYDDVKHHMTNDGYQEVWMDGVVVRLTVLSNKMTSQGHKPQVGTMGVMQSTTKCPEECAASSTSLEPPRNAAMTSPTAVTSSNNVREWETSFLQQQPNNVTEDPCFLAVRIYRDYVVYVLSSKNKFQRGDKVVLCVGPNKDIGEVEEVLDTVEPQDLNRMPFPVEVKEADKKEVKEWEEMNRNDSTSGMYDKLKLKENAKKLQYTILGIERAIDNRVKMQYTTTVRSVKAIDFLNFTNECQMEVPDGVFYLEHAKSPPPVKSQLGPIVLALLGVRAYTARMACGKNEESKDSLVEATMRLAKAVEWAETTGAGAPPPLVALRRMTQAAMNVNDALMKANNSGLTNDAKLLINRAHQICRRGEWGLLDEVSAEKLEKFQRIHKPSNQNRMTVEEALDWANTAVGDDALMAMRYAQHVVDTDLIEKLTRIVRNSNVESARSMLIDALKNAPKAFEEDPNVPNKVVVSPGIVCGQNKRPTQPFTCDDVLSGPDFDDWVHESCKGKYILFTPRNAHPLSDLMQAK